MSLKQLFSSDRSFQIWQYTVSHRQLLLRSNKDGSCSTRLEILFKDVSSMSIPTSMEGVVITECDGAEGVLPAVIIASEASRTCYRIATNAVIGFITAATVVTGEDALDYWDPSSLLLGGL